MNTNKYEYFLELLKQQKALKGFLISCGSCLSWLKMNSALSAYNSTLSEGVWEIQR
jgi:hypothetical protein